MVFQLGSALLDACVLSVLSKEDTYGYAITQTVQSVFEVSESTLYPVLRRLQKESYLTTYDKPFQGRNRRYYSVTPLGVSKLREYQNEWQEYKSKVDGIMINYAEKAKETEINTDELVADWSVEGELKKATDKISGEVDESGKD